MPPHSARDGRRDRPGPAWLTFEGLIPLVWIAIYTCFYASALLGWNAHWNWALMGDYLVLLLILYLLWSPIGTLVTWQMQRLNR
jgi:tryptophan-rich sensory protein